MGASMGGVLARYALRQMEIMGCGHCTKMYGTFDAPHQGANIPLSLQQVVAMPVLRNLDPQVEGAYQGLGRAAPQQLLINNITSGASTKRATWQNWLNTNGHPQNVKKIAITNGHPDGHNQFNAGRELYGVRLHTNIGLSASISLKSSSSSL